MSEKVELKVAGMTCEHCVMRVRQAAEQIEGVSEVKVDLASGRLEVAVENPEAVEKIRAAITDAGYTVEG